MNRLSQQVLFAAVLLAAVGAPPAFAQSGDPVCQTMIVISPGGTSIRVEDGDLDCVADRFAVWTVVNHDARSRTVAVTGFNRRTAGGQENTPRKLFSRPPASVVVRPNEIGTISGKLRKKTDFKDKATCPVETDVPCFDTKFKYTAKIVGTSVEHDPDIEVTPPPDLVPPAPPGPPAPPKPRPKP